MGKQNKIPHEKQQREKTEWQGGTDHGYIGDLDGALERLREVCKESGIFLHTKDSLYKYPVLYWPDLRTVIIFANATLMNIQYVLSYLH